MILKGKKVTVVGLGKSGFAAAKFLVARKAIVRLTDSSQKKEVLENASYLRSLGVEVETGGHREAFVLGSDLVVTSPGIPKSSLPLILAARNGIPVVSEIDLAATACAGPIIGVTGSNGKTTTSNLVHALLSACGKKSVLCGNVGYSFLDAVPEINRSTVAVVELSSFQLEDSPHLRPSVAVVLNVSPNHLDRHKTMAHYIAAKERIFSNQRRSECLILNRDDEIVRAMARKAKSRVIFFSKRPLARGVFLRDGFVVVKTGARESFCLKTAGFPLRGAHNFENILAAVAAASLHSSDADAMRRALLSFKTLEHRMEPVGSLAGVEFVNDSKSTTIQSTRAAILALHGPIVLVAGGRDKGASFGDIEGLLEKKVKTAVLYGEAREKIAAGWKKFKKVELRECFGDAVRCGLEHASAGDTLLLSPMCASFDQFDSFEGRGEAFKRIFSEMKAPKESVPADHR